MLLRKWLVNNKVSSEKEESVIVGFGEFAEIACNYFNHWLDYQVVERKLLCIMRMS